MSVKSVPEGEMAFAQALDSRGQKGIIFKFKEEVKFLGKLTAGFMKQNFSSEFVDDQYFILSYPDLDAAPYRGDLTDFIPTSRFSDFSAQVCKTPIYGGCRQCWLHRCAFPLWFC